MNPAILFLQSSNPLQNPLTPIILMVVIFYLVLFLPMRRRQRKADEMLKNLQNGDRVVTTGGLVGTIVALGEDNTLTLRVKPDNLKLQFARSAVTGLVESEEEKK
jgi:preprotein translocase subunit YajC